MVAPAPVRHRRKIGTVGFQQEVFQTNVGQYLVQTAIPESGNAADAEQKAGINHLPGVGEVAGKAMEDAGQAAGASLSARSRFRRKNCGNE